MSQRVKVGVAGVGHMGKEHARIYSELQEAELVGVHDSNPDTARKIAAKCKTRAFGSLEEMVDAVDAASIVTPTSTHLAIAEPFLKRGKHVLVEKPIAMNTEEARKLVDLAEKRGLLKKDGNRLAFTTTDGEVIKQFRKAWESNEDGCLDKVMQDFSKPVAEVSTPDVDAEGDV